MSLESSQKMLAEVGALIGRMVSDGPPCLLTTMGTSHSISFCTLHHCLPQSPSFPPSTPSSPSSPYVYFILSLIPLSFSLSSLLQVHVYSLFSPLPCHPLPPIPSHIHPSPLSPHLLTTWIPCFCILFLFCISPLSNRPLPPGIHPPLPLNPGPSSPLPPLGPPPLSLPWALLPSPSPSHPSFSFSLC